MSHSKRCEAGRMAIGTSPFDTKNFADKDREMVFYGDLEIGMTHIPMPDGSEMHVFDPCNLKAKHSVICRHTTLANRFKTVHRLCDDHFQIIKILSEKQTVGDSRDKTEKYTLPIRISLRENRL